MKIFLYFFQRQVKLIVIYFNYLLSLYLFLGIIAKFVIIRFIGELIDFYWTKLFPYLKNIDLYFMKLISKYSSENTWY